MRAWILFGACVLGVAACGGSTKTGGGGSSSVTGNAGGQPVATTDTVAVVGTQTQTVGSTTVTVATVSIAITNVPNTCSEVQGHHHPASTSVLSMGITTTSAATISPGTYTIGQSHSGTTIVEIGASFDTTTATCATATSEHSRSGTITLTTVSSTIVQGSFDLTMTNGDHLTGNFTAPVCAYDLSSQAQAGTTAACGS